MDTIEDVFNTKQPQSILTQRTLFYVLFILLYDLQFGIDSLGKGKKHKVRTITKQQASRIEELGNNIAQGKAPRKVMTAYQKNTTNIKSRTSLFNYFKEKVE